MSKKQYRVIESVMVCILLVLCFSIYKKHDQAQVSNSERVTQQKICYLTFDDGPSNHTEQILDILAKYDAKATFFIIGEELREDRKQIIERIINEGHAIGLHSMVHDFDKLYSSVDYCVQDFREQQEILKEDYGIDTCIFRFPGGSACYYMNGHREEYIQAMQKAGFRCYDWNVSGEDSYGNPSVWSVQNNVLSNYEDYTTPIVLLHDANVAKVTVDALPQILESMQAKGYEFHTLEETDEYRYR